jgi:hypothetical protein
MTLNGKLSTTKKGLMIDFKQFLSARSIQFYQVPSPDIAYTESGVNSLSTLSDGRTRSDPLTEFQGRV